MSDKVQLIKQEIEKQIEEGKVKCQQYQESNDYESLIAWSEHIATCGKLLVFIDSLPEESGSEVNFTTKNEDLVEEVDNFLKDPVFGKLINRNAGIALAHHFAEWQKQQMEEALQTEYEKGRFDMKEEMLKNAVEGVVHHFPHDELAAVHYNDPKGTPMSIYISSKGLSAGDKVKIIIVKEE